MAPVQHLLAAAFGLCGFLFLLHVGSVNSLTCKACHYRDPNCNSGNVGNRTCRANDTCAMIAHFSPYELDESTTIRGCSSRIVSSWCNSDSSSWRDCYIFCSTDMCNGLSITDL